MTLRELLWMAHGRDKAAWAHTSSVLAMIVNVNRDPKHSRPCTPADCNPHLSKGQGGRGIPLTVDNLHMFKGMFTNERGK